MISIVERLQEDGRYDGRHRECIAEIKAITAERDALKAEVERLKGVSYDLAGQLMVLRATKQMTATIDAARSGQ